MSYELSFDDISLIPRYSDVLPSEVNVDVQLTPHIRLHVPILSAAMDTVTMAPMAIAMAKLGGLGIIHKNLSPEDQADEIRKVKRFGGGIVPDPWTVRDYHDLTYVHQLIRDTGYSSFPVVDDITRYNSNKKILLGLVTARDIKFQKDPLVLVSSVMTPYSNLVVGTPDMSMDEMIKMMYQFKVERLPIVELDGTTPILKGLVTLKDANLLTDYPNAVFDAAGRLLVGAAVGVSNLERDRATRLVKAGADVLVIDTAHGHSKGVIDMVRWVREEFGEKLGIIAGNVVTSSGVEALSRAGADCVKIGIGPGSICTTRVVTGVGVPQFSALRECSLNSSVPLIADGGIRYSGDIVKAMAAGADAIMIGGLLAGTDETPGEIEIYQGKSYKNYRGMGSLGAMTQNENSKDRYRQSSTSGDKLIPEGIEGRVPYRGSVERVIFQLVGGLRSGMGYLGAHQINEIYGAEFVIISHASLMESHPHDVSIVREAPNYSPQ